MPLPYQGSTSGIFNYNANPTLIPNFYPSYMNSVGNALDAISPAQYMKNNPAANASATATIGGTITNGDTVTLTLTQAQLAGGAVSFTMNVLTSMTIQDIAEGLASGLTQALVAAGAPAYAVTGDTTIASEAIVTVIWPGPMGNAAVLSTSKTGTTETVTLAPSTGVMSGGSGAVMPFNNFTFSYNNCTLSFVAGKLAIVDAGLAAALAAADMPVV